MTLIKAINRLVLPGKTAKDKSYIMEPNGTGEIDDTLAEKLIARGAAVLHVAEEGEKLTAAQKKAAAKAQAEAEAAAQKLAEDEANKKDEGDGDNKDDQESLV